jgi:FKBP-type peptidyl-prolyl cis-trans isomerase
MTTTRKRDRIVALAVALFFLVFASALSIMVIWQVVTTNKNSSTNSTATTSTVAGTMLTGFTPVNTVNSLQIADTKVGSGQAVKAGDTVTVNYTGAVASTGLIFQSTKDTGQPAQFSLNGVIQGWQLGIPGMKVGGTRRLLIPAAQAYGATPPAGSGIPANAPLVFDIELIKIGS